MKEGKGGKKKERQNMGIKIEEESEEEKKGEQTGITQNNCQLYTFPPPAATSRTEKQIHQNSLIHILFIP